MSIVPVLPCIVPDFSFAVQSFRIDYDTGKALFTELKNISGNDENGPHGEKSSSQAKKIRKPMSRYVPVTPISTAVPSPTLMSPPQCEIQNGMPHIRTRHVVFGTNSQKGSPNPGKQICQNCLQFHKRKVSN
jgi:hypothetical protein